MPNIVTKVKTSFVKPEREFETKEMRRRRLLQREKFVDNPRTENVWERLSKIKKCASCEYNIGCSSKQRAPVNASVKGNPNRMAPTIRGMMPIMSKKSTAQKSPSKTSVMPRNHIIEKKSLKRYKFPRQSNVLVADKSTECGISLYRRSLNPVKSVKELFTARSKCHSISSSEDSRCCSLRFISTPITMISSLQNCSCKTYFSDLDLKCHLSLERNSQDSFDEFEMAPLMSVPTRGSLNYSVKIRNEYKDLYNEKQKRNEFKDLYNEKQKSMEATEMNLLKNVVKTESRYCQLRQSDNNVFKEFLRAHLVDLIKNETKLLAAVRKSVSKIEVDDETSYKTISDKSMSITEPDDLKPQVDIIFKNVPTPEREVIILRALSENLEATLKRTKSKANTAIRVDKTTCTVRFMNVWHLNWPLNTEHNPEIEIRVKGIRQYLGIVQEYTIAHKTLVELKSESDRYFYLPNSKATELKMTCFQKLRDNPDIFMRYIKPKNTLVAFNLLEQDPIFFNSFLFGPSRSPPSEDPDDRIFFKIPPPMAHKIAAEANQMKAFEMKANGNSKKVEIPAENKKSVVAAYEVGDGIKFWQIIQKINENKEKEEVKAIKNQVSEGIGDMSDTKQADVGDEIEKEDDESKVMSAELCQIKKAKLFKAPVRGCKRRRIREGLTPLAENQQDDPKMHLLLKTVIIGATQIALFLLLIMAATFPEARCI